MQIIYIASDTRRKAERNHNSPSTPTSAAEAYAIRTIMRRARVSQAQAALIAELYLVGRGA